MAAEQVIAWSGEVDYTNQLMLSMQATQALTVADLRALVIDLTEVTFMDSIGLALVLHVRNRALERGITFSVANPRPSVRRLLILSGLEKVIAASSTETPGAG